MIRFHFKWMISQFEVLVRSFSFYLCVLLLGLTFILSDRVYDRYSEDTCVLIYTADDEMGAFCYDRITKDAPDGFEFILCQNIDDLKRQVMSGDVSCGVVFDDDISIYQSVDSVDGYIVQELIYPYLKAYNEPDFISDYLQEYSEEAREYILNSYDNHLNNMAINLYEIKSLSEISDAPEESTDLKRTAMSVLRGIIMLLIAGLCIYDSIGMDRDFYKQFGIGRRSLLIIEKVFVNIIFVYTGALVLFLIGAHI